MNILIIDDMQERHEYLKKWIKMHYIGVNIFSVKDRWEAEKILKKKKFGIIFLDHDLGNRVFVDSGDPNTGFQIACFIVNNNIKYNEIIVHSMNPWGAENIKNILPNVRVIPFINFAAEFIPKKKVEKEEIKKQETEELDEDDNEEDASLV